MQAVATITKIQEKNQNQDQFDAEISILLAMLEGKAVVGETDMLLTMQQDALDHAAKALDFFDVTEATEIACFIKKV